MEPVGINQILVEKYGYEWVNGKAWKPGTAPLPEPPIVIDPIMPDPIPNPEAPVHDSRFETVDNAIEFAEANGQGDLSVAEDGTITNRFGETMVYDSTGNLAPAPRDTPIMDPPVAESPLPEPPIVIDPIMPDPLPNPEAPVHDSRFDTVDNAIEFAEANGQGDLSIAEDGTITNRFGETMVYDSTGNLAPAPRDTPIMDPGIIF